MSGEGIPFLWLCGPSGVGKSAVGWEILGQLHRDGIAAAYLDADQVGLCHPAPAGDPDNHRVKSRGLGAVWPVLRAAGARCLILSGSVERRDVVHDYAEQVPGSALTLCRLRVGPDELRARFVRRGWMTEPVEEAVREADRADVADLADLCVDTDGLGVAEVAGLVRERAGRWPRVAGLSTASAESATSTESTKSGASAADRPHEVRATGTGDVPVLWLCGPVGVGKSAVGWEIYAQVVRGGIAAGYVDLAQLGFCLPAPDDDPYRHRVRAAGLRALWPVSRAAGARCLVVTGRRRLDAVPAPGRPESPDGPDSGTWPWRRAACSR